MILSHMKFPISTSRLKKFKRPSSTKSFSLTKSEKKPISLPHVRYGVETDVTLFIQTIPSLSQHSFDLVTII